MCRNITDCRHHTDSMRSPSRSPVRSFTRSVRSSKEDIWQLILPAQIPLGSLTQIFSGNFQPMPTQNTQIAEPQQTLQCKLVLCDPIKEYGVTYWYEDYASFECEWTPHVSSHAVLRFKSDPGDDLEVGCTGRLYNGSKQVGCLVISILENRLTAIVEFG